MLLALYKNIDLNCEHFLYHLSRIDNKTVVFNMRFVKLVHGFLKISKMLTLHVLVVYFRDKILSDCRRQEGCTSRSKIRRYLCYILGFIR